MPMLNPFAELIVDAIQLYIYIIWIYFILGWLIAFNIVNRYQPTVQKINFALFRLTDPALRPIRRILPDLGSVDISPIILFLLLRFLQQLILYYSLG